jgi:phosphate transport system substrate-binding protein
MKNIKKGFLLLICLAVFSGCSQQFNLDGPIAVYTREASSGTRKAFLDFTSLTAAELNFRYMVTSDGTQVILSGVASNKQAIAYDSLGFVDDTVKTLKLNGVAPNAENIKNGAYQMSRPFALTCKLPYENMSAGQRDFVDFLLSAAAAELIEAEGYIVFSGNLRAYMPPARHSFSDLNIAGSTSVQPVMDILAAKYKSLTGVNVTVSGGGSAVGLQSGRIGGGASADFGIVSNEVYAADEQGYWLEICRDGIAIIVNKANPIDNITTAQLKRIYSNVAKKWSEI